ncbi:LysR family transcriptional regulator [Thalassobius sp. MITS945101]|uniref:LysR family transcriptional regulator n=1 Tax=Thalassobius sp. MITS945101 TaxID=3096994 RepID=UPI00399C1A0E
MTNLDHLHVVHTVAETGSFQLASEKLNKARSAVSYSVKQVEMLYQVEIFDRSTYRPSLTRDGKVLLGQIRHLLAQAQQFEDFVRDLKGDVETELRIGVSSNFPIPRLADLLQTLKSEFPTTTLHLEVETASGERQLMEEKVDIAIFAAPSRSPFIDYREITQMRFPLVVAPELLDQPASEMNKEDLARHPQVVVKSTDEKSPDVGLLQQAPKWFVTDMSTKKALILAGLGWGRLPDHMVAADIARGALVDLEVMGDVTLPICLTKRAGFNLGVVGQRIWSHF